MSNWRQIIYWLFEKGEWLYEMFSLWCQFGVLLVILAVFGPLFLYITFIVAMIPIVYVWTMVTAKPSLALYMFFVFLIVVGLFAFGWLQDYLSSHETDEKPYLSSSEADRIAKRNLHELDRRDASFPNRRSLLKRERK
ncbi:MAG: hypothetical protein ACK449_11995 [Planctomycetota bacterium]|jgi:hypothetical protein